MLSPLDIVPGVSGVAKFSSATRTLNLGKNAALFGMKTGVKTSIQRGIVHVDDLVKEAGKLTASRLRNAGSVVKNKVIKDTIELADLADSTVTFAKKINLFTERAALTPEGVPIQLEPEKTHVFGDKVRRMLGEMDGVNVGNKGTGNVNLKNIDEFIDGTKNFDDVVDDFARLYSEKIQTNKTWSWNKSFHGGEYLTARQRKLIKEKAIADGLIPNVNVIKADGMRYGFADFKSAGLVVETKDLPESLWLKSDEAQFEWLDNVIGGRPEGMTWHHTEVPGKMELIPFGIHNITIHNGGRSIGMWADAPR
ncbi:HNH endonuclease [Cytobacillus sp. Hz8]|uniref:HNH endonuclease signature motif containing protein n=1 Tax=Cytobacillus sp. Hz8 TaxID=3347168 RepID=UPI0035D8BBF4